MTFFVGEVGAYNLQATNPSIYMLNVILLKEGDGLNGVKTHTWLTSAVQLKDKIRACEVSGSMEFSIKITSISSILPRRVRVVAGLICVSSKLTYIFYESCQSLPCRLVDLVAD